MSSVQCSQEKETSEYAQIFPHCCVSGGGGGGGGGCGCSSTPLALEGVKLVLLAHENAKDFLLGKPS